MAASKRHPSMSKAISAIVLDEPFYGFVALRLEYITDDSIDTMATDGKVIRYNPQFVETLTIPELVGVLKHEYLHIIFFHHTRRGERDRQRWNEAADYVINAILIGEGQTLPDGGLFDRQYADYSTEQVYNMLPPDPPKGKGGEGPPLIPLKPTWGLVEDHPDLKSEGKDHIETDVKQMIIQAADTAKIMGKSPASLERYVETIRESKMPWHKFLWRYFTSSDTMEECWRKANRRWLAMDLFLPSRWSQAMGDIVLGVDTSASVHQTELDTYFGVMSKILRTCKPSKIHVIYCDAQVENVQTFKVTDLPLTAEKMKPQGGGGTRFQPVFDYVEKNKIKPKVLLYLTDMYGPFDFTPPKYDTIWCATSNQVAPWGRTIRIDGQ